MALNSEVPKRNISTPTQRNENLSRRHKTKITPNKFTKKGIIQDLAIDQQGHQHNEHSDRERNKFHIIKYIVNNERQSHSSDIFPNVF